MIWGISHLYDSSAKNQILKDMNDLKQQIPDKTDKTVKIPVVNNV